MTERSITDVSHDEASETAALSRPSNVPDDLLPALHRSRRSNPGQKEAETLRDRHRNTIEQALCSRGDPFARNDTLRLLPLEAGHSPLIIFCRDLPVTVGRTRMEGVISFDVKGVSRKHFEIFRSGALVCIRDLKSKNGTFLNGHPVQEEALCEGDIITAGTADLRVMRD